MRTGKHTMYQKLAEAATPAVYVSGGTAVLAGMSVQSWAAAIGALAAVVTAAANIVFKIREEHRQELLAARRTLDQIHAHVVDGEYCGECATD